MGGFDDARLVLDAEARIRRALPVYEEEALRALAVLVSILLRLL